MENNVKVEVLKEEPKVKKKVNTVYENNPNISKRDLIILMIVNALSYAMFVPNLFKGKLGFVFFVIILLGSSIKFLENSKLIRNKQAYKILIPIVFITLFNAVYSHNTVLNISTVLVLLIVFYVKVINPNFKEIYGFRLLYNKSDLLYEYEVVESMKHSKDNSSFQTIKKIMIGLAIAFIPLMFVIALLSGSDIVFEKLVIEFIRDFEITEIFIRFINGLIFFFVAQFIFLHFLHHNKQEVAKSSQYKGDNIIINTILVSFNLMFLVFCFIQLRYLVFGSGEMILDAFGNKVNYATYAREGFFQLLFVTVINYSIILLLINKYRKELKHYITKLMTILLSFFTVLLIFSSFYRMSLYIQNYGFTTLRLQVIIFLVIELIVIIYTIIYIAKEKFDISRVVFIALIVGACLNASVANEFVASKINFAGNQNNYGISIRYTTFENHMVYKDYIDDKHKPNRTKYVSKWEEKSLFEYFYYN